jgi:hypothetical protein
VAEAATAESATTLRHSLAKITPIHIKKTGLWSCPDVNTGALTRIPSLLDTP